jgi:hypothetical protein
MSVQQKRSVVHTCQRSSSRCVACVRQLLRQYGHIDLPVFSGSNTLEARVKPPLGKLSLFDAVPFLAPPHFGAPRLFCAVAAEREGKKQGKEIVKIGRWFSECCLRV